ncbi:hypothetical protein IMCC26134_12185 [Verrucomicrobia bacterium IMCC26134]|nr:hypothetical protein IMCC26134_12185 [Verrucomicrobia bacterium IMCC26134]
MRLHDLLRREVCLEITRAQIENALAQVRVESEVLRKTRPPFLFLHAKNTRTEFEERSAGAIDSEAALARGLQQLIAAQPRVHAWVEDDLETFLRDSQPPYLLGLAMHRFPDDWQRMIVRFDQRVAGFRAALGTVLSSLGVVPGGMALAANAGAFECLMPARQWAALLDYEFTFFNRIADMQRRNGALGAETLKRMPERQFGPVVSQWARLEGEPVRRALMDLRAKLDYTAMEARAVYVSEASMVANSGSGAESYVYPFWEALRQLMRLELDLESIDEIVAETEQMVAAAD